jgi:hypothetical protein
MALTISACVVCNSFDCHCIFHESHLVKLTKAEVSPEISSLCLRTQDISQDTSNVHLIICVHPLHTFFYPLMIMFLMLSPIASNTPIVLNPFQALFGPHSLVLIKIPLAVDPQ